jgi:hypothetical protein
MNVSYEGSRDPARPPFLDRHLGGVLVVAVNFCPDLARRYGTAFSRECSPYMSLRADKYCQKAAEPKQSAAQAKNQSMKRAFEERPATSCLPSKWNGLKVGKLPLLNGKIREVRQPAHARNYNQFNRRIRTRTRSARVGIPSKPLTKKAASPL